MLLETGLVAVHGLSHLLFVVVQEQGEDIGHCQFRRHVSAGAGGAQQEQLGRLWRLRAGLQPVQRMLRRQFAAQELPELVQLFRQRHRWLILSLPFPVILSLSKDAAPQGCRGAGQPAGPASDAQVHPSRGQRRQHVEVLGHLVGAVMLEHHSTGADADARGVGQQVRDQHLRRRPHHLAGAVMLRHPEAMIAPLLGLASQLDGVPQGVHSVIPKHPVIPGKAGIRFMHRALVQDAQLEAHFSLSLRGRPELGVYCR